MSLTGPALSPSRTQVGLTILRLVTGFTFLAHGNQKLFTTGVATLGGFFGTLGIPLPHVVALLISVLEFAGGTAVMLGLLTRFVAFWLVIDMLGAAILVHLRQGFFMPNGAELVIALGAAAAMLMLGGPGAWALDGVIGRRSGGSARARAAGGE